MRQARPIAPGKCGAMTTAATRTKPFFHADHVGSLLRPPELMAAREALARDITPDDQWAKLKLVVDTAHEIWPA
jgi:hypothetical protein